ncbi:archaeosortase A, PGF-CTERM-specific [Haladaptatus litoreus]|uniref:Archaeosortase A, PGF-CTERM-specific n=1 Tax=Haladaptatus litoreus TaxID=553468 RepID=A0A1N6WRS3_9EURY|nr:archaeosortase A [Haladaptatus litoreus]SIQ92722.1 archaeosortase A, PGF-CTERM-specific [Haladaptatus litoreus]
MTAVVPLALPVPSAAISDTLAWLVIVSFVATAALERYDRETARTVGAGAWVLFGIFWGILFPRFAFEMKSFVEGALSLAAVPLCVYAGYQLYSGRDTLFVLSRAVAAMGIIYVPFSSVEFLRQWLVEQVSFQTNFVIEALGYNPEFTVAKENGYHSAFIFTDETGHSYYTYLVLACTGIGSMSIFGGLIAAVKAPLRRKLKAFAVAISIIWVLNVVRNVFIALAFGNQWFQYFVDPIMSMVGYADPGMVSFFIADRVLSQMLAVVALVAILWLILRDLPELLTVVEDVAYLVTGNEYDLHRAVRTDGGR